MELFSNSFFQVVNAERYLAIMFPYLKHKNIPSASSTKLVLLAVWIVTLGEATAYTFAFELGDQCLTTDIPKPGLAFGILVVAVAMPFITVVVFYIHIVIVLVPRFRFMARSSSLMTPTSPPTNNEPAIPAAKQSTNLSIDQSTNQSTDQTNSTLISEQLSIQSTSQSTQLSLDTTHTQQSITEDTGDATTTYSAHNSRPKQRIPAVHRGSRSYSASRTSRTPSRKSCHSVKTVGASTPDIRIVLKGEN